MFDFTFEWDSCESGAGTTSFRGRSIKAIMPYLEELMNVCCPGDTIEVSVWNEDTGSEWTIHLTPNGWTIVDSVINDA